jgi:hypothetical protein
MELALDMPLPQAALVERMRQMSQSKVNNKQSKSLIIRGFFKQLPI